MDYIAQYARFVLKVFSWKMLLFHVLAVFATLLLVVSGLDWAYFVFVLNTVPSSILSTADLLGFFVPIALLVTALFALVFSRKQLYRFYAQVSLYAIMLGFTLSTIIKAFTGRTSPPHFHHGEIQPLIDNSHAFHFGFMREQIIGGWPSSHATIAFALAVSFALVLPPRLYIRAVLFGMALFIGIGVTFGFHWLSEFVAGACLGTAIGLVVGRYYKSKLSKQ